MATARLSDSLGCSICQIWHIKPLSVAAFISLQSFLDSRFGGYWIKQGKRALDADLKTYGPSVQYFSSIQNRAEELLGRKARPGIDYALSEIVHCKSKKEEGVREALISCAKLYMMDLLCCSGAVVLVLVGDKVLNHWNPRAWKACRKSVSAI